MLTECPGSKTFQFLTGLQDSYKIKNFFQDLNSGVKINLQDLFEESYRYYLTNYLYQFDQKRFLKSTFKIDK